MVSIFGWVSVFLKYEKQKIVLEVKKEDGFNCAFLMYFT